MEVGGSLGDAPGELGTMRLVLSVIALTSVILPLAAAHTVICAPDLDTGECTLTTLPTPVHAFVAVAPCVCFHAGPTPVAIDRDVLP